MSVQTRPETRASLPKIRDWPLLGSAPAARKDLLGLLDRVARECGEIGGFRLGLRSMILVNSPRLVQTVLMERASEYGKGEVFLNVFTKLFGTGLSASTGELHRRQRELMAPVFTPRAVTRYTEPMVEVIRQTEAGWEDGETFELMETMGSLTTRLAGRVLLDTEISDEDELGSFIATLCEWGMYTITNPFAPPLGVPTPLNRRANRALAQIRERISGMVAARWNDERDHGDVLSVLLHARDRHGQGMSFEQLADEMRTLCGASLESMTDALTWSFYALIQSPEVYARLEEEVDTVLGSRPATREDVPSLPYSLQVFKEVLRLYPPAAVMTREALVDTDLGGYPIRKGTTIMIAPYLLQRQAKTFPDPERFDPTRFTPEMERSLPRCAYLPFGAGPRTCIGNHLSYLEGQLVVATVTQRLRFELVPGQQVTPELKLNLRPRGGIMVKTRRRA
jgi:cytochrome P450